MATLPKHYYRLQGHVDPETYTVLFDHFYPTWGMQTKIIKALCGALARHVKAHCDLHVPAHEREQQLEAILDGITFKGPSRRTAGRGHGRAPAARALGRHPAEASGEPATPSDLAGGEYADATGWTGPGKEAEAPATAR